MTQKSLAHLGVYNLIGARLIIKVTLALLSQTQVEFQQAALLHRGAGRKGSALLHEMLFTQLITGQRKQPNMILMRNALNIWCQMAQPTRGGSTGWNPVFLTTFVNGDS